MRLVKYCCLIITLTISITAYGINEKLLLGKINGQRYTSLEKRFSVDIPFELNERNRNDLEIRETTNAAISKVTFSHKLPYRPVYRMEIASVTPSRARENPFEDAAYETLDWYKNLIEHFEQVSLCSTTGKSSLITVRQFTIFSRFAIPKRITRSTTFSICLITSHMSAFAGSPSLSKIRHWMLKTGLFRGNGPWWFCI